MRGTFSFSKIIYLFWNLITINLNIIKIEKKLKISEKQKKLFVKLFKPLTIIYNTYKIINY